ncbi:oligomeric golgi complex component, COG2-domain-containing protein [Myxozyma melibiosi]|uniref:Conserved oligomeric Golgi complex subunit 2 n=1 Tax=Myxozyma melibiosi TaxID=54550 RepID=A0ABR1FBA2_9ASCO
MSSLTEDYFSQHRLAPNGSHSPILRSSSTEPHPSLPTAADSSNIDDMISYSDSDSHDSDYDANGLPFPKPIQRAAFSAPGAFDPDTFLLAQHRYQRLEDLHSQLEDWSKVLKKELVELINRDYADFVGLGKSVSGGTVKVDDIKLAVIGFRREVEGMIIRLDSVIQEIEDLLSQKAEVRQKQNLGRTLLFFAHRLQELELALHVHDSPSPTQDEIEYSSPIDRLRSLCMQFAYIKKLITKLPRDHPFVSAQQSRVSTLRDSLLSEIRKGLKEYSQTGGSTDGYGDIFKYVYIIQ